MPWSKWFDKMFSLPVNPQWSDAFACMNIVRFLSDMIAPMLLVVLTKKEIVSYNAENRFYNFCHFTAFCRSL